MIVSRLHDSQRRVRTWRAKSELMKVSVARGAGDGRRQGRILKLNAEENKQKEAVKLKFDWSSESRVSQPFSALKCIFSKP